MGKYIKSLFVAFIFIFLIDNVNALSPSAFELGYNLDDTWNGYSTSNLSLSLTGMETKYLSSFNYRFHLTNYFQQDDYYNFTWQLENSYIYYNEDYTLKDSILELDNRNVKCYFTNGGSVQTADACFESYSLNISEINYRKVKYTLSFVPKANIYRILIQQEASSSSTFGTTYGWYITDVSYIVEEDKTSALIGETNEKLDGVNDSLNDLKESSKENTEEIKDTIKDTMETCRESLNLWSLGSDLIANKDKNGTFLLKAGTYTLSWDEMITNSTKDALFSFKDEAEATFYSIRLPLNNKHITFTLAEDMYFYRFYPSYDYGSSAGISTTLKNVMLVEGSTPKKYEEYGAEICINKLDDVSDSINGLTGAITDSSSPDTSGLANAPGWLPAGPVDSIATLPINLLQSLTNNMESACTPINLPIPFVDDDLTLDCPATLLRKIDGFWLFWEGFGLIAGVWILYKYFINLYKWVESHLSMDEKESLGKWGGV